MAHEEVSETMEHVIGFEISLNHNVEALSTEFIENCQYLDWTTVVRAVCHEIIRPHVIAMCGPEPDTRPIIEPQTSAFGLFLRNLQPLLAPDAFHPLMIDSPTLPPEQGRDAAIPITPIPFGQCNDFVSQSFLGICPLRYEPLSRPRLPHCPTGTPFRYSEFSLQMGNASSTPLGA